jgi:hypothetical protein
MKRQAWICELCYETTNESLLTNSVPCFCAWGSWTLQINMTTDDKRPTSTQGSRAFYCWRHHLQASCKPFVQTSLATVGIS